MAITNVFLDARITATKTTIVAYETAIDALVTSQVLSYTLNTGQGSQTVTRQDLKGLQESLDVLYERLENLCNRRNGAGTVIMRPGF